MGAETRPENGVTQEPPSAYVYAESQEGSLVIVPDAFPFMRAVERGLIGCVEAEDEVVVIAVQNAGDKAISVLPIERTEQMSTGNYTLTPVNSSCVNCSGLLLEQTVASADIHAINCPYCQAVNEATQSPQTALVPVVGDDSQVDPDFEDSAGGVIRATSRSGCLPPFIFSRKDEAVSPLVTDALRQFDPNTEISLWRFRGRTKEEMSRYYIRLGDVVEEAEEEDAEEEGESELSFATPRLQKGLSLESTDIEEAVVLTVKDQDSHSLQMVVVVDEYGDSDELAIPIEAIDKGGWIIRAKSDIEDRSEHPTDLRKVLYRTLNMYEKRAQKGDTHSVFDSIRLEYAHTDWDSEGQVPRWADALEMHKIPFDPLSLYVIIDVSNWSLDNFSIARG